MKNLTLSLAAGLLGGLLSRYLTPIPAYAQSQLSPPREIRAQNFVLVNDNDVASGVFGFAKDGKPTIWIIDQRGRVRVGHWWLGR